MSSHHLSYPTTKVTLPPSMVFFSVLLELSPLSVAGKNSVQAQKKTEYSYSKHVFTYPWLFFQIKLTLHYTYNHLRLCGPGNLIQIGRGGLAQIQSQLDHYWITDTPNSDVTFIVCMIYCRVMVFPLQTVPHCTR